MNNNQRNSTLCPSVFPCRTDPDRSSDSVLPQFRRRCRLLPSALQLSAFSLILFCLLPYSSFSYTLFYTDRNAWESQAGTVETFFITPESITLCKRYSEADPPLPLPVQNQYLKGTITFPAANTGLPVTFELKIHQGGFYGCGIYYRERASGDPQLSKFHNAFSIGRAGYASDDDWTISFSDGDVYGFGIDIIGNTVKTTSQESFIVYAVDGRTLGTFIPPASARGDFVGVLSSVLIGSVKFDEDSGDNNILIANPSFCLTSIDNAKLQAPETTLLPPMVIHGELLVNGNPISAGEILSITVNNQSFTTTLINQSDRALYKLEIPPTALNLPNPVVLEEIKARFITCGEHNLAHLAEIPWVPGRTIRHDIILNSPVTEAPRILEASIDVDGAPWHLSCRFYPALDGIFEPELPAHRIRWYLLSGESGAVPQLLQEATEADLVAEKESVITFTPSLDSTEDHILMVVVTPVLTSGQVGPSAVRQVAVKVVSGEI